MHCSYWASQDGEEKPRIEKESRGWRRKAEDGEERRQRLKEAKAQYRAVAPP
jgi:hypothetical protein